MDFGGSDFIDAYPSVTSNSVTVKWREGIVVDERAAVYIGYYVKYRKRYDTNDPWTIGANVSLDVSQTWQQGTVRDLQPDTEYEIDISVYRVDESGTVHESDFTSRRVTPLYITTLPGKTCIITIRSKSNTLLSSEHKELV